MSIHPCENVSAPAAKADRRAWIGLAVLAVPAFIYAMDLTVLHLAVPQITQGLKPTAAQLLWIVDIYGFMVAGALVTMGTLGDRIGRRRILIIGAIAFGLTSVAAAFAPNAQVLIAARALQGLAAATLAPSTLSLIRNMFHDEHERRFAVGVWIACFSAGTAVGPVIGGLILSQFWWGAVFLINAPIMLVLIVLAPLVLPEFRDPDVGRMDVLGATQSIASVLLVIYGVKNIAETGVDVLDVLAIVAGIVIGIAFFRRQARLADPLVDVRLFRDPMFSTALAMNVVNPFIVVGAFLFIAQYLQLVLDMGPFEAGLWLAPCGIIFALGSLAAAPLVRVFSPARVVTVGFLVTAGGFFILAFVDAASGPGLMLVGLIVLSAGIAPVGTITTDFILGIAPPERAGAASAISETSFELGAALGIAVLGSIVTALYRGLMEKAAFAGFSSAEIAEAMDTLGGAVARAKAAGGEHGAALLDTAREAFLFSFAVSSAISLGLAVGAAALAAVFLRRGKQ